jgi:hypothetical protein
VIHEISFFYLFLRIILGPHIEWFLFHSNGKNSHVHHVAIVEGKELKVTKIKNSGGVYS